MSSMPLDLGAWRHKSQFKRAVVPAKSEQHRRRRSLRRARRAFALARVRRQRQQKRQQRRAARKRELGYVWPEIRLQKYWETFVGLRLHGHAYSPPLFHLTAEGWRPLRSNGRHHRLDNTQLRRHLSRDATLAAKWHPDLECNLAVIDIDTHDEDELDSTQLTLFGPEPGHSALDRLWRVRRAFPISLIIRSSKSDGLHVYVFFDRFHRAAVVRESVIARLAHVGLKPAPGHIEVWPSNQNLRLPLGAGSCIVEVDPERTNHLRPTYARFDSRRHLHRQPHLDISHAYEFARSNRVPLPWTLPPRPTNRRLRKNEPTIQPALPQPARAPSDPTHNRLLKGAEYRAEVAQIQHGARTGMRRNDAEKLLFSLYVVRGLDHATALKQFEHWLRTADHTSRDLTGKAKESCIRSMITSAPKTLDRLDRGIEAGRLVRGVHMKRQPGAASLEAMVTKAKRRATKHDLHYKKYLRTKHNKAPDRKFVRGLDVSGPLIRAVALFLSLCRCEERGRFGPITAIRAQWHALKALVGDYYTDVVQILEEGEVLVLAEEAAQDNSRLYDLHLPT